MDTTAVNCGKYMVTLVEERGDVKVSYLFAQDPDGLYLIPEAVFESEYHRSGDLKGFDMRGIYSQKNWDDCPVDPSYTISDATILTLVIEYLDGPDDFGKAIIVATQDPDKVKITRESFMELAEMELALDDIMGNEEFADFLQNYINSK